MKNGFIRIIAATVSVCGGLCGLCGCSTQPFAHGIPNFAQVEPGLYRGGQPTAAGWQYLRAIGVSNVVKLDEDCEGSDAIAQRLGLSLFRFPISTWQQTVGEPPAPLLWSAVERLQQGGTFVHCLHGQDRTGLVVAMHRVHADHWPKQRAEAEMLHRGFHPWLRGLYWAWQEDVK